MTHISKQLKPQVAQDWLEVVRSSPRHQQQSDQHGPWSSANGASAMTAADQNQGTPPTTTAGGGMERLFDDGNVGDDEEQRTLASSRTRTRTSTTATIRLHIDEGSESEPDRAREMDHPVPSLERTPRRRLK